MSTDPRHPYFEGENPELSETWPDVGACAANVGNLERLASVAGGAGLVAFGLSRRSLPGLAVIAVGGALIYRGVTGHCHLYDFLAMDTAHESAEATPVNALAESQERARPQPSSQSMPLDMT